MKLYKKIKTPYQEVVLFDTETYGRALVIDGELQSTQKDEHIYHFNLVTPAMQNTPQRVLILGGGEGATAREVLRYSCVKDCTMVDIDPEVIELCKKYLRTHHANVWDRKELTVINHDAADFVRYCVTEEWDSIICDLTSDLGFMQEEEFYKDIHRILKKTGIFSMQAGEEPAELAEMVDSIFATINVGKVFIPSFQMPWGFITAWK